MPPSFNTFVFLSASNWCSFPPTQIITLGLHRREPLSKVHLVKCFRSICFDLCWPHSFLRLPCKLAWNYCFLPKEKEVTNNNSNKKNGDLISES